MGREGGQGKGVVGEDQEPLTPLRFLASARNLLSFRFRNLKGVVARVYPASPFFLRGSERGLASESSSESVATRKKVLPRATNFVFPEENGHDSLATPEQPPPPPAATR